MLKPFHLFSDADGSILINIQDMSAVPLSETSQKQLNQLTNLLNNSPNKSELELLDKLGLLYSNISPEKKPTEKVSTPILNMSLFLCQKCNLDCVYCYGEAGTFRSESEMDEKTAFQAVDWFIKQSEKKVKLHINFIGGEPFLKFALMRKVVHYARQECEKVEKRVDFRATTNGTLLDDEKIAFITEENVDVLISLDGPKSIHDKQRPFANGRGSYDVIVKNCRKLLQVKPQTAAHAVVMPGTDPEMIKSALLELGFQKADALPASNSLFKEKKDSIRRNTSDALNEHKNEAILWLDHTKKRNKEALRELKRKSQLHYAVTCLLHHSKHRYNCGAGIGFAAVSCEGDIYLCHRFVGMSDYKIGSIFSEAPINQPFYRPTESIPACASCFARYYCAGGCKYDNAATNGSVFMPASDMCDIKRSEFMSAASVVARLNQEELQFLFEEKIYSPKPCPLDFG